MIKAIAGIIAVSFFVSVAVFVFDASKAEAFIVFLVSAYAIDIKNDIETARGDT